MASRETEAIIQYVKDSDAPHRVTAILGTWKSPTNPCAPHAPGSNHCHEGTNGKGLAVDFGGRRPGTSIEALEDMAMIHAALMKVAPQLKELIFNGPGITIAVKNGRVVDGLKAFGATTWAAHRNHLHSAVDKGTFLVWPKAGPAPAIATPVAGSGPPTVTPHPYPEGEEMLTRHDVDIPALDGQGRGWVELDVPPDSVVSIICNGPYPPVDGYWEMPVTSRQNRAGKTIVAITEGAPNQPLLLSVWTTGE